MLILALILSSDLPAQENTSAKEAKKEASRKKKEAKQAKMDSLFKSTGNLLESRQFVLEALYLSNRIGSRVAVSSTLNFIACDSEQATLQIGRVQAAGYNGVGGVTAEGPVTRWKITSNSKNKNYLIYMATTTNVGVYDISISVDYRGYATATITGLSSGSLTFEGNIVALKDSGVYKGMRP